MYIFNQRYGLLKNFYQSFSNNEQLLFFVISMDMLVKRMLLSMVATSLQMEGFCLGQRFVFSHVSWLKNLIFSVTKNVNLKQNHTRLAQLESSSGKTFMLLTVLLQKLHFMDILMEGKERSNLLEIIQKKLEMYWGKGLLSIIHSVNRLREIRS